MAKPPCFEMANADSPEEIIAATQRSVIDAIKLAVEDLQKSEIMAGCPGLTWSQVDYILDQFRNKMPTVIHQAGAM